MTIEEQENQEHNEWLASCIELAEEAGFRGLLHAYVAGHPEDDYNDLLVGAQEILRDIYEKYDGETEDLCARHRLLELIDPNYPPTNIR
jgi:hypothetical protein